MGSATLSAGSSRPNISSEERPRRELRGIRAASALILILALPFAASCDLGQLGSTLEAMVRGLTSEISVARVETLRSGGDIVTTAQRDEIISYLRQYSTGLSRHEEVALANAVIESGRESGTDYRLILAVIHTESTFSNWAVSPNGAFGLMQVMPSTGRWLAAGLELIRHRFPDHHAFCAADIDFDDEIPVLMTEKDAVKCRRFADPRHWYVPVQVELPEAFGARLLSLLGALAPVAAKP